MSHKSQETYELSTDDNDSSIESRDLELRDVNAYYYQTLDFKVETLTSLDFNFQYHKVLPPLKSSFYVKFNTQNGSILYTLSLRDSTLHSIQNVGNVDPNVKYQIHVAPRRNYPGASIKYKIAKSQSEYSVSVNDWKCYSITGVSSIISIEAVIVFPINDLDIDKTKSLTCNRLEVSDYLKDLRVNTLNHTDHSKRCMLLLDNGRTSIIMKEIGVVRLQDGFDTNKLNISVIKEVIPDELPDIVNGNVEDSVDPYVILSEDYDICKNSFKSCDVSCKFRFFKSDFLKQNARLSYGDNLTRISLSVERDLHSADNQVRIHYNKHNKGAYLEDSFKYVDESPGGNEENSITFGLSLRENDVIDLKINNKIFRSVRLKISTFQLSFNIELQLRSSLMKLYKHLPVKNITGLGGLDKVIVDDKHQNYQLKIFKETGTKIYLKHDTRKSKIDVYQIKTIKDIFDDNSKVVEVTEIIEEDGKTTSSSGSSNSILPVEPSLSKNFVRSSTSILSQKRDEEIFNRAKKFYVDVGVPPEDVELLIFQMAVSFCTSKNSMGDSSSALFWKTRDGNISKFLKSSHSRLLNSMSKIPCNVERILMRNRSEKILGLLRSKRLEWPFNQAIRRGLKPEYAYMACDFLDLKNLQLTEGEQLAITSVSMYSNLRNKHKRTIVNVNQIS